MTGAERSRRRAAIRWRVVALLASFGALAVAVALHATRAIDGRVHDALTARPGDRLVEPLRDVAVLAGPESTALIAAALVCLAVWRRPLRPVVGMAIVALAAGALVEVAAKSWVDQPPPLSVGDHTALSVSTAGSYPSGHTVRVIVLGTAIVACVPPRGRPVATVTVAVVGAVVIASRVVLGVHWLSDVVAGLLLGAALALPIAVGAGRAVGRR